jgi:hypothetical protein
LRLILVCPMADIVKGKGIMHSSAIYDPHASETPSQAQAASQRLARLRRIGSHARPDTPISASASRNCISGQTPEPDSPVVSNELLFELWVERQRQKHAEALKKFEDGAAASIKGRRPPSS